VFGAVFCAAPVFAAETGGYTGPEKNWSVTGGLGFPNFFSGQLAHKVTDKLSVGVGAGYSFIPEQTQSCGAKVNMSGTSYEIVTRYHFTGTSFFGGINLGYQDFYVKSVQTTIPGAEYDIKDGAKVYYATPHVGWFKAYESGVTVGFEVGVRVPLSKSRYEDKSGPGDLTPDVRDKVNNGLDIFSTKPMPFITLLRLGYSF